jgi:catechol 2,3-dioxygenase-like lactoylglutathione lyase family enzyme
MSIDIQGIHHASILSTDLDRSRAFYTGVLGLQEIKKPSTFGFTVVWFQIGDQHIHLIPADEPDTDSPRHFAMHVEDAKAARIHLKDHGFPVSETTPIPGADRFFTKDPDGNRLELIQFSEDYGTGR